VVALIGTLSAAKGATINVVEMTVDEAESSMSAKRFTSHQLTEAFLGRISTFNPTYHAVIPLNPDALAEADAQDRLRAAGQPLGPLSGIPVVVKDTMDMAGLPTTAGWAVLCKRAGGIDLIPERDSPVVARLRAAGAVILGKTNVPVFSVSGDNTKDSWAGSTLNAAAPDRMPGASSAGTATAVAASFAVLGLGEETGGSIQNPAAAQALVGVKPTFGLVPNVGVVPLGGSTRDVVGPLARTVKDAAITLGVLAWAGPHFECHREIPSVGFRNLPLGPGHSNLAGNVLIELEHHRERRDALDGRAGGSPGFGRAVPSALLIFLRPAVSPIRPVRLSCCLQRG
jgi:Asp-tRNA(Asn)/Glu-tRNA(Gln) amidotransferase A subunit family amidase